MVVLPIHQGDPDVTMNLKQGIHDATLILLNRIIGEAAHKHGKSEDRDKKTDTEDFVSSLSSKLKSAGIRFQFVQLESGMPALVQKMYDNRSHGGLSVADYTLLFVAKMLSRYGCHDRR